MFEAFHDRKMMILFGCAVVFLIVLRIAANYLKSRSEAIPPVPQSIIWNRGFAPGGRCALSSLLCLMFGRIAALVRFRRDLFPGNARVHDPGTHAPQRSLHAILEFFRNYAVAVFPVGECNGMCFSWSTAIFCVFAFIPTSIAIEGDTSHFLERVRENSIRDNGLRLLPQPPARPTFSTRPGIAGQKRATPALSRARRPVERCLAVRLGKTHWQTQNRLAGQPE